jgi:hypothetical protein
MALTMAERKAAVQRARRLFGVPGFFHRHARYEVEFVYDLCADVPNGPRTYHGIAWACACGRVVDGGSCKGRWLPTEAEAK